jgi:AraC-like DNA-binding protein
LLSTEVVPPPNRISYWRDVVRESVVALDCRFATRDEFRGSLESRDAGGLHLTRVDADAQTVARTPELIARASDDAMLVSLVLRGGACLVQDGQEAWLSPGDLVLKDTTRPYEMLFGASFTKWVLNVPRAALRQRLATPEALTAARVSGAAPLGRLARDFLTGFAALPATTPHSVQERLAGQALDLIAMALTEHAPAQACQGAHRTVLSVRMRSFVEQHLTEADLSGAAIANAFGMSARSVRDVFAAQGTTPGRHILARRLQRARIQLTDPTQQRRAIGDIAYAAGFSDLSHFSRSFRAAYGRSPREARQMAEEDGRAPP